MTCDRLMSPGLARRRARESSYKYDVQVGPMDDRVGRARCVPNKAVNRDERRSLPDKPKSAPSRADGTTATASNVTATPNARMLPMTCYALTDYRHLPTAAGQSSGLPPSSTRNAP